MILLGAIWAGIAVWFQRLFGFSSMIYGILMPTGQTLELFLTPRAASRIAVPEVRLFSIPNCRTPSPHPRILRHLHLSPGDDLLRAWRDLSPGELPQKEKESLEGQPPCPSLGSTPRRGYGQQLQRPSHASLCPPPLLAVISFLVIFLSFSFWLLKSYL